LPRTFEQLVKVTTRNIAMDDAGARIVRPLDKLEGTLAVGALGTGLPGDAKGGAVAQLGPRVRHEKRLKRDPEVYECILAVVPLIGIVEAAARQRGETILARVT
jgi:hypothetical protein